MQLSWFKKAGKTEKNPFICPICKNPVFSTSTYFAYKDGDKSNPWCATICDEEECIIELNNREY